MKPAVLRAPSLRLRRFSPAFSGGLIEAIPRKSGKSELAAFSPAFSGGLIEATSRRKTTC